MWVSISCAAIAFALVVPVAFGQSKQRRPAHRRANTHRQRSSRGSTDKALASLLNDLRAKGLTVERAGEVSQPFFTAKGQALTVNGENVQVFRYARAADAEREAKLVSPTGSSVGTNMMTWMATPHFYRKDNLIVLYVGSSAPVVNALTEILGKQFAGG